MNRIVLSVWVILLLLSGCAALATEGVEIHEAWARPATQGANGAVYFVIHSSAADEITGASSDVAEAVEMHESTMSGDVMQMHQLESVPLPAGKDVTFAPGGLHIMLVSLKQELKVGNTIEITLHFKTSADIRTSVPIMDNPPSGEDHPSTNH